MKFPVCNSICDVEIADTVSLLMNDDAMNDEDANFDDKVDEPPTSLVPENPLIKDCAVQLANFARGSLYHDKMVTA